MILIADSGSTKTDWCLLADGNSTRLHTDGINPYFQTQKDIAATLQTQLTPYLQMLEIDAVYYYGAGCTGGEINDRIAEALKAILRISHIEVNSDLLGAARALCGHTAGIAAILGTGSNSCFYDGEKIAEHVPPLGFILGDEGSGAALGKRLVSDCLKGHLPLIFKEQLLEHLQLTVNQILGKIYSEPYPNRFLASLAPFIHQNKDKAEIKHLLEQEFSSFFTRNIALYSGEISTVHAVGSVAHYFSDNLQSVARTHGRQIGRILQSPLDGLISFHQKQ